MVLTSLSTEQLIGTNGSSYTSNFSIIAWTVQSVIPLCVLALCLLPRYLRGGFTTIPEFFEERYDKGTRQLTSLLFLIGYALVLIPGALYSGAIAFIQIFDMTKIFHIDFNVTLWIVVWSIGIIGSLYAVFGGLKGVAVSDTLNGFALVIGGALIPFFALKYLGEGNFFNGIQTITTTHYEKLNAWGSATDPVPWTTVFTGIMIVNFFYWGTNQAIIQRALGAKNLAEGQKGILIAGFFLLLLPGMLHLPGVISFHIFGDSMQNIDLVYPSLVEDVLPKPLLGFFIACLFGAILSTFNSFVNSASTLFCYDIYRPIFNKDVTEEQLIKIAKISGLIIALISMCVAPMLQYGSEGLFLLLRKFAGFFNIPIIVLVMVGFLNRRISGAVAKIIIFIHMILYFLLVWVINVKINFVHVMGALFLFDTFLMYFLGIFFKRKVPYELSKKNQSNVSLKNWKYAHHTTYLLILGLIYMYIIFSPIGLAGGYSIKNISFIFLVVALLGFFTISKIKKDRQIKRNTLIDKA